MLVQPRQSGDVLPRWLDIRPTTLWLAQDRANLGLTSRVCRDVNLWLLADFVGPYYIIHQPHCTIAGALKTKDRNIAAAHVAISHCRSRGGITQYEVPLFLYFHTLFPR